MSLPAAAVPVAVLVLAWDETTPAVRALVEASEIALPLFDSVVVLVPAGPPDAEEISQEEFLPLVALPELPSLGSPAPESASITPVTPALATGPATAPLLSPGSVSGPPEDDAAPVAALPAIAETTPETLLPAVALPSLSWSEVRVLRLSSFTLPELARQASQALPQAIWRGDLASPAAPYVGRLVAAGSTELTPAGRTQLLERDALPPVLGPLILAPGPTLVRQPAAAPAQGVLAAMPPTYFFGELPAPAIDAESDLVQVPLEAAPDAPDAAVSAEPLATDFAAAQADWPSALTSLRDPAPLLTPPQLASPAPEIIFTAAEAASAPAPPPASPIALPVPHQFDAPNLNFQVIQYARFAVPVALAEAPFEVIYAPAWPTWLAAQELRQRTGQPLVLHVASLAAPDGESVETATNWQAELQRQALHRADLILTETPALAYRLRHELSLPAHLVQTVPAANAAGIAQALHTARPRPLASPS